MTLNFVAVIKALLVMVYLTMRMILVFVLMMVMTLVMLVMLVMMVVGVIRKVDANGEATIKGGKTKPK